MIVSLYYWYNWQTKDVTGIIKGNTTNYPILIFLMLALSIILGLRPTDNFGDTLNYTLRYRLFANGTLTSLDDEDWAFDYLLQFFALRWDVSFFFIFVDILYIFCALWGIYRLFKNNTSGGMLFFLAAFSFFSYATNGIRNGLACSLIILGLSFLITKNKKIILGVLLCIFATFIHKSVSLPIVCLAVAFFIKNINIAIFFWILSIFLNLGFSTTIENFFSGLGFDDRLTNYIEDADEYAAEGFKQGFRPDFLLYSVMPIFLGWYAFNVKRIKFSRTYQLLLSTYIFSNSFWVMLMNAAYSNRFAYLSWFLYPLVIAYPCLRLNLWGASQGKNAGKILLAYTGFTFFMTFVYYSDM